jgi:replicative DNA helicase
MSRSLKILARELEIPVMALSQLSRTLEQRQDKRPMLSDLRESGSLEQDADAVILLHHEETEDGRATGMVTLIVAKSRFGRKDEIELRWRGHQARIG